MGRSTCSAAAASPRIIGDPYHSLLTIGGRRSWACSPRYLLADRPLCAWPILACGPGALGETRRRVSGKAVSAGVLLQRRRRSRRSATARSSRRRERANFLVLLESFVSLVSIASRDGPHLRALLTSHPAHPLQRACADRAISWAARVHVPHRQRRRATRSPASRRASPSPASRRQRRAHARRSRSSRWSATSVVFFSLSWTIVHPIDEASPLWGVTPRRAASTRTPSSSSCSRGPTRRSSRP